MKLTRDELADAVRIVRRFVPSTPAYRWPVLGEAVNADVVVKHENHTPVGTFKVRGGLVYVERLQARRPDVTGLVSATRGNHGQSIAMHALGADVIEHGHDFQAAREHAAELAKADPQLEAVPSFHADLVTGVATYALELFEQERELDTVYVPVGIGSGCCGLIAVRDMLGLPTKIVRGGQRARRRHGTVVHGNRRGKHVGVIHTGSNIDADMAAEVLSGATPAPPSSR